MPALPVSKTWCAGVVSMVIAPGWTTFDLQNMSLNQLTAATDFSLLMVGVNAIDRLTRSSQVFGCCRPSFSRQSLRMNSAKDWAEKGTAQYLPSEPLAASQDTVVSLSPLASLSLSTSRMMPCFFMLPSCAVSLMTMSGSFLFVAACCSLVSKSSKSAVTLVGMPLLAVNFAARSLAVFSAAPPGGLRTQISSGDLSFWSVFFDGEVLPPQPARARPTIATNATVARRVGMTLLLSTYVDGIW